MPNTKIKISLNYVIVTLLICCATLFCSCTGEKDSNKKQNNKTAAHVTAAVMGLDSEGNMQVSKEDTCSICGMPIHKHLRFATGIEIKDGAAFYFCGTQCLIRAWLKPEIYIGVPKENLKTSVVTSYFNGENLNGKNAFFIMGSDVMGPMGPSMIALATEREKEAFISRHGGTSVFGIDSISKATWEKANGRKFEK